MQSGEKHVRRSRRAQKANRFWQPNSLVIRRTKLNNGLRGKRVSRCSCVCVCRFDETGRAMLGGRSPWPPYLGPSVSIRQHDRHSPFCHDPCFLQRPHVYSITVHYLVSAWRHHPRKPQGGRETKKVLTSQKKKIPFLLRFFLSCFLEVITGLPKLDWGK